MPIKYNLIKVFTNENAKYQHKPLAQAILSYVQEQKIAARSMVTKGIAGGYENGEMATLGIEVLSFNMPLKIEIALPASELSAVLPSLEVMVGDGLIMVEELETQVHRSQQRFIPYHLKVRDVMTANPRAISLKTPASEVAHIIQSSPFNGLPVIDSNDAVLGIVTQGDLITRGGLPLRVGLLSHLPAEAIKHSLETLAGKTAADIMTKSPIVVRDDEEVRIAVKLMLDHKIKRLPVIDAQGKLSGIFSRLDIFKAISQGNPDWKKLIAKNVVITNPIYVADIMLTDTATVSLTTSVSEVLKVIDKYGIQRVAVVDDIGKFVGIISDRDIMNTLIEEEGSSLWKRFSSIFSLAALTRTSEMTSRKTAADVMNTKVVTIREDALITEAAQIMTEQAIKRLPVVSDAGVFTGMISRDSLLRAG